MSQVYKMAVYESSCAVSSSGQAYLHIHATACKDCGDSKHTQSELKEHRQSEHEALRVKVGWQIRTASMKLDFICFAFTHKRQITAF